MKTNKNLDNSSIFSSKSNVLKLLKKKGTIFTVEKLFDFTVKEWETQSDLILQSIQKSFSNKIIVRSSAKNEDSPESSNAGRYESILNINSNSKTQLTKAIKDVIHSYKKNQNNDKTNQIIIQTQAKNIVTSGVIFSKTSETGSPYFVINYEDGNSTDSVTKGLIGNSIKIFRDTNFVKIPTKWKNLILSVKEIEKITHSNFLDIEFGLTKTNKVIIFQARPLTTIKKIFSEKTLKLKKIIHSNQKKFLIYKKMKKPFPAIFSDMTDWNPAEIIGNNPHPLDYSLYDFVIMDKIWKKGRINIGYKKDGNKSLMIKFGNKPYVDIEASFLSLMPEKFPKKLTKKLLNFYLKKLKSNPELHDKTEFQILLTCFDLSLDSKLNELTQNGFSKNEIKEIRKILLDFTNDIIKNFPQFSTTINNYIDMLERKRNQITIIKKNPTPKLLLDSSYILLNDCKSLGTIPFSTIARIAFISSNLFYSAKTTKIIDDKFYNNFLSSLSTPLSDIRNDVFLLGSKKISKQVFLKKYGHLRPGTYDISMPRYDGNNEFFKNINFNIKSNTSQNTYYHKYLESVLKENDLLFENISFLDFLKNSLILREKLKFEFTKNLSDAIENIAKAGELLGFTRYDLSYLDIKTIFKTKNLKNKEIIKIWKNKITKEKLRFFKNNFLFLPPVIYSENDFEIVSHFTTQPNFITNHSVKGNLFDIVNFKRDENLKEKIILIENADPGYDWIFTKNPLGLITKYGGVASHMAIRCSEIGLPAAIGVGEILYDKLYYSTKVLLDCKNNEILSLENQKNDEETEIRKTLKSLGYIK